MEQLLQWILSQVSERNLKRKDVATLSGIRPETISQYFNRKKNFTSRAARLIMTRVFKFSPKETEFKMAEFIARESVNKMDNVALRSAFSIDYNPAAPKVILMEDSKIKFCTKSYFYRMDRHFILAFQAGEIIDSRYAVPLKEFKELCTEMGKAIQEYERMKGVIGSERYESEYNRGL